MCDGNPDVSRASRDLASTFGRSQEQEERQGHAFGEICRDIFVCAYITHPFLSREPSLCLPSLLLFGLFLCVSLTCGSVTRLTERLMLHFFRNRPRPGRRQDVCLQTVE